VKFLSEVFWWNQRKRVNDTAHPPKSTDDVMILSGIMRSTVKIRPSSDKGWISAYPTVPRVTTTI